MNDGFSLDLFRLVGIAALIPVYLLALRLTGAAVERFGRSRKYAESRILYVRKYFKLLLVMLAAGAATVILGIDFRHIWLVASSFFALAGIALFASWSMLSNLTAGALIFFNFPYRIGDRIRIIDGDNSIEGVIGDMNLYYIQILDDQNNLVLYPNNLALQKPIRCLKAQTPAQESAPSEPGA